MIQKLEQKEKEDLFKRYMSEDLKMYSYINFLISKNAFEKLDEIELRVFNAKKSFGSASNFLIHNNIDIKLATKTFGEPMKTKDLGEFGNDLDCSYLFFIKVNGKLVMFFIDDRGTNFYIEKNTSENDFLVLYEELLQYLKVQFKDLYEIYLKMIKNA